MSEHISIERLNALLDGLLTSAETEEIDGHLEACGPCRNDYATLAETVRALKALPRDALPPSVVWDGIAARIEGGRVADGGGDEDEVSVYRLPTAGARAARRFALTASQLATAATFVAVVSAGLMWMAIGGGGSGDALTERAEAAEDLRGGAASRAVWFTDGRYTEVVSELEEILEEGGSVLTPETLASIQESLATIDAAIADVHAALGDDPNSDLLMRLLATHQRTKLRVLQRAAAAVQAQT